MSYRLYVSKHFAKEAKRLCKKYPSFKNDLEEFKTNLLSNPLQGVELCPGIRKIRIAIGSKHKGLSGGARIITYNLITKEQDGEIAFLLLYDKSEASTVKIDVVKGIVKEMGFSI